MKKQDSTIRFAIYMFISIVSLFFILKFFGLEKITELRLLNVVISAYFSNKLAKRNMRNGHNYVSNFGSLLLSNLLSVFLCGISLLLYIKFWEPSLMNSIGNGFFLGHNLSIDQIVIAIIMEGSAASIIVSFSTMQYWKNMKVEKKKWLKSSEY